MVILWKLFLLKTGIRGTAFFSTLKHGCKFKTVWPFSVVLFHVKLTSCWFHCSAFHIFFM